MEIDGDEVLDALVNALQKRMQPRAPAPPPQTPRKRRKKEPPPPSPPSSPETWARPVTPAPPPARQETRWERTLTAWRKKHGGGRIPERGTPEYEALVKVYYKTE